MKARQILPECEKAGIDPEADVAIHPDFPGYYVVDGGHVATVKKDLVGKEYTRKIAYVVVRTGYVDYVISDKVGRRCHKYAHRLVAECFIPNPDGLREVNHKDFDKTNNKAENLEWISHRQNQAHAARHDRWKKLKKADREKVVEMVESGMEYAQIAEHFGVSYSCVATIMLGKGERRRENTPIEIRTAILERYAAGELPYRLAKEYGLKQAAVYNMIKRGTPKRK
jgi:uncharacterized protein (DUF433 family)